MQLTWPSSYGGQNGSCFDLPCGKRFNRLAEDFQLIR